MTRSPDPATPPRRRRPFYDARSCRDNYHTRRSRRDEDFPQHSRHGMLSHDLDCSIRRSADDMGGLDPIPVIDVFAGPGGLGEGFSALRRQGRRPFRIALSIEKDPDAHATLNLRSFLRQFAGRRVPEPYYDHLRGKLTRHELYSRYPTEAQLAANEAWHAELGGTMASPDLVRRRIRQSLEGAEAWVLIGGPPCQAYSVAGRSRNRGVNGYALERDDRHRLYEEYLRIVGDLWPPIFVMNRGMDRRVRPRARRFPSRGRKGAILPRFDRCGFGYGD